jgi:hypothetical protein
MVGVTLQTGNIRVNIDPSRLKMHGGNATHLRLEKPHFLFLEGSGGAPVAPTGTAVALVGASAAPAGASTDDPAAGGDGGGGFHLSGGPPHHSLFPPPLTRSSPASLGGEPLLLAQPVLLTLLLPALPPPDSPLLPARRPLLFPSPRGAGSRQSSGCRRSDCAASTVTPC